MRTLVPALRLLLVLTILTGLAYPLAVWAIARGLFPGQAGGSLIERDGHVVGSALLAQRTTDPRYVHPRASAGDYATVSSGASNAAWTSAALAERVRSDDASTPAVLLTTSGSGLDPHLPPEAVRAQLDRVAAARHLDAAQRAQLDPLIAAHTEGGGLSPARVNVLQLNLALDETFGQ